MPKAPKKPLRGLQDIRTHAGKVDRLSHPHMAYMRISCLEMEKARRNAEKESALRRVASIDDRLKEIDAEKSEIESMLALKETASGGISPNGKEDAETMEEQGFFKIRY